MWKIKSSGCGIYVDACLRVTESTSITCKTAIKKRNLSSTIQTKAEPFSNNTQRTFFDNLGKQIGIQNLDDWYHNLSSDKILKNGGRAILSQYENSPVTALMSAYPEHTWNPSNFTQLSHSHSNDVSSNRAFFDDLGKKLGIQKMDDWYDKLSSSVMLENNGSAVLKKFSNSPMTALMSSYPEYDWAPWRFNSVPVGYWKSLDNQRKYFEWLGNRLGVTNLEEWSHKLTKNVLAQNGGGTLLAMYHGSPIAVLMAVYPQHNWTKRKDNGYWKDISNQRKFFDELGQKLGVKTLDDWYEKLTKSLVLENGGVSVTNQYKGSPSAALMSAYPEHDWIVWKFKSVPQNFWKDLANQRNFLDDLGKKLGVKTLDDWYDKLSATAIDQHGGRGLLHRYKQSPQAVLMAAYPEHDWVRWKFNNVPMNFWSSKDNIAQFLAELSDKLSIQTLDDWYRVDFHQLLRFRAAPVVMRHKGLYYLLKQQYPHHPWDAKKFQQKGKKAQRWLLVTLKKIFPNEEILEDYMHSKAVFPTSNRPMQLDIFIPSRSLAFEYQGKQHYQEVGVFSSPIAYQQRDEEKRAVCAANNIKLIEIPYWWNRTQESLEQIINAS